MVFVLSAHSGGLTSPLPFSSCALCPVYLCPSLTPGLLAVDFFGQFDVDNLPIIQPSIFEINKSALHNYGMKSLNSTLKTLPLCAFAPLRETKIIPLISNTNKS
jgi:hypothetical protein